VPLICHWACSEAGAEEDWRFSSSCSAVSWSVARFIRRVKSSTFSLRDYVIDRCTRILLPLIPACLLTALIGRFIMGTTSIFPCSRPTWSDSMACSRPRSMPTVRCGPCPTRYGSTSSVALARCSRAGRWVLSLLLPPAQWFSQSLQHPCCCAGIRRADGPSARCAPQGIAFYGRTGGGSSRRCIFAVVRWQQVLWDCERLIRFARCRSNAALHRSFAAASLPM
jgi:hypothetical protein